MNPLKVDHEKQQVHTSIRELIYPEMVSSGTAILPFYLRTSKGTQIHTAYQESTKYDKKHTLTSVKSEFHVKIKRKIHNWTFFISGRTDLVQITSNSIAVEEIKSVNRLRNFTLESEIARMYILQLLFYAQYFKTNYPTKDILCKLVLVDVFTEEKHIYDIPFHSVDSLLDEKCESLLHFILASAKSAAKQKDRVETLVFPFEKERPHQKEIMEVTYSSLEKKRRLLLLAPSGLGKTIGTLFPSLKFAIGKNKRLFIVTSKTTQQKIYEDTLCTLAHDKGEFHAIILTAKEKMCLNTTYICDPAYCIYANSYPDDYEPLIQFILKHKVITAKYIRKKAREHKTCPFELALDCSLFCDVVIGDYNYVFNPVIKLQRFFKGNYRDCICIIDEAHNLPDRARDYYSPEITKEMIHKCEEFICNQPLSSTLSKAIIGGFRKLETYIENTITIMPNPNIRVASSSFDYVFFQSILEEFEALLLSYMGDFMQKYDSEPSAGEPFVIFIKQLHFFCQILEESHFDEFEQLIYPQESKLKIYCKSAANHLKKQMKGFHSVIAQSATLYPIGYYREMLGFPEDTEMLQYTSPFPLENRLYMDYPHVSTRYGDRDRSYAKIAKLIQESIQWERGNYLVFFPSFQYLHNVLIELDKLTISNQIIIQNRKMTEKSRKETLEKLRSGLVPYLLLAVHGGIFSEGVDYMGDMAIGAFIISPGLPQYCYEQELIKTYFDRQYARGFEFAYRNPGLTRVIQAAGRIFRSETDKGFVILICQRFHSQYYRSVFPKDWEVETPPDISHRIKEFWASGQGIL